MSYAVNTSQLVIRINGRYYLCHEAVWYVADGPSGPWVVSVEVPKVIYTIPPSYPVYHVKYVYVYDYHDGNVHRKTDKGWQKRDKSGWSKPDKSPRTSPSRSGSGRSDLNSHYKARDRGSQRTRDFQRSSSSSRSRSSGMSRSGGGRRGGGGRRR